MAILLVAIAYFSPVSNTNTDPKFGLLVSQAMLLDRTVQMDPYRETLGPTLKQAFVEIDGHIYYYFPLGTIIFSMPFVGLANLLGMNMADAAQEAAMQNLISAVVVGLSFLVIYRICRCFLPAQIALLLATMIFMGSALISTMSTALWSIDFAVLFVALSLLILSKQATGKGRSSYPYLIGFFLFGAYLCRPSTFLFVGLVLGYLFLGDRETFWRTAALALILLIGFLVFVRVGYGSWLPPYYNEFGRLAVERRPLYEALLGNLISPSRGLFIYSPMFLLTLAGAVFYFSHLKRKPLFWLTLVWFFLQLFLVARATRWWGGSSFGPRILTEVLPGLALLTALAGNVFFERGHSRRLRFSVVGLYSGLALWAVFLNGYLGLFNKYTALWHGILAPNVDFEPDYLWNWEYPQFLANNESLCRRNKEYMEGIIANEQTALEMNPYILGRTFNVVSTNPYFIYNLLTDTGEPVIKNINRLDANVDEVGVYLPIMFHSTPLEALFTGWSLPEDGFRWSMCERATIAFKLHDQVDPGQAYELSFQSGSYGKQRANVWLNGVALGQVDFIGGITSPSSYSITVPAGLLLPGEVNQIVFDLPDVGATNIPHEVRPLGLSFFSFILQPAAS